MSPDYSSAPAHEFDYVQDAAPSNPESGESWYDTGSGEAKVYDGGTWATLSVTDHSELQSVAAGQHFNPGNVLTFNSGVLDLVFGDPLTNNSGTLGVSLGNALGLSGGAIAVQEGQISHDNLAGVSAGDHFSPGNALAWNGSTLDVQEGGIAGSNLSDYPWGTGDLGFDTATQSELDNHAGNRTAHHAQPAITASDSVTEHAGSVEVSDGGYVTMLSTSSETTIVGGTISGETDKGMAGYRVKLDGTTVIDKSDNPFNETYHVGTVPPLYAESSLDIDATTGFATQTVNYRFWEKA